MQGLVSEEPNQPVNNLHLDAGDVPELQPFVGFFGLLGWRISHISGAIHERRMSMLCRCRS